MLFANSAEDMDVFNEEGEDDFLIATQEFHDLSLTASDWTVETLVGQIEKGNIELSPEFQRREVWGLEKKSSFIESLVLGIPVPQIVLAQRGGTRGKYVVLDGKQRLLSIFEFYKGNQKLGKLKLLTDMSEKTIGSLDDAFRDALDNSTIRAVRLSGWKSDSVLYTIFHRLNSGSVPLSTQELRSALLMGPFIRFADRFTSSDLVFASLFSRDASKPDFRMRDIEVFTRYCGIVHKPSAFQGNLRAFLDETTAWLNDLGDEAQYEAFASEAQETISVCQELYDQMATTLDKKAIPTFSLIQSDRQYRFNRAVFDALCFPLKDSRIRSIIRENLVKIALSLQTLLSSPDFINACSSSTKTSKSLVERVGMWSRLLAEELHVPTKTLVLSGAGDIIEQPLVL